MGDQIGINYEVFKSETSKITSSANSINFNFSSNLSTTNIDPFKNYLTMINELKSGINNYKNLAMNDVKKVASTGQAIKEADQKIGAVVEKG